MRKLFILMLVAVSACSSPDEQRTDSSELQNVAPCMTEEVLREANVSEAEIMELKEQEANANAEAWCG